MEGRKKMSKLSKPELSEKNPYWIERHRYYELKHFCLQYPIWKKAYLALDGMSKQPDILERVSKTGVHGDPTANCVIAREFYLNRIVMIDEIAIETDYELAYYILLGVTEGHSYDTLKMKFGIPCCKDVYYELYRKFFWLLSKKRE